MSAPRVLGLFLTAALLAVTAATAPPAATGQIKIPIQIKPGFPPTGPGFPGPKTPPVVTPPKTPTPGTPTPSPGQPGTTPGFPPSVPSGPAGPAAPAAKKDDGKWPKEIGGKSAEVVVKDMRTASDPAVREAAVRTLPLFGPKGREFGASELVEAMTRDSDWNVRLAALEVAPTVLFFYAPGADTPLANGINGMVTMLGSEHMPVRLGATVAIASIGPHVREATSGRVLQALNNRAREGGSWQIRRAAAAALGSVGLGMPDMATEDPADRKNPDQTAVGYLLDLLKQDNCAAVRREAVNSLIALGPVSPAQQKRWRADLDSVLGREKDKSVLLWTRICILKNDPNGVKGNELLLDAVAKVLQGPEPGGRLEACQGLAILPEKVTVGKLEDVLAVINNPKEEPIVVAAAIAVLPTMPSQAKITLPTVDRIKATHPNEDVRKVAAEASDILSGRKKA